MRHILLCSVPSEEYKEKLSLVMRLRNRTVKAIVYRSSKSLGQYLLT
jgi:hypothetical protein